MQSWTIIGGCVPGSGSDLLCRENRGTDGKDFSGHGAAETDVLGTRASREQYEAVKALLPDAQYHEIGRVLRVRRKKLEPEGLVAVCTGGTSDMPVAEEAALTAEFFGARVERIYDVGVAGIHRLLDQTEKLRKANCILAIAGMEGLWPR